MIESIINDIKKCYGMTLGEITPVSGGYMNLKWKATCANGTFLIKQFNANRYDDSDLENVEAALQRQILLKKRGVCCPEILLCDKKALRRMESGIVYMVMEFRDGKKETPQTITLPPNTQPWRRNRQNARRLFAAGSARSQNFAPVGRLHA